MLFSECFLTSGKSRVLLSSGIKQSKKIEEIPIGLPDP